MSDVLSIPAKFEMQGNPALVQFPDLVATMEVIQQEAMRGCGSSYECFAMTFSRNIDAKSSQLSDSMGGELVALAKKSGFYVTEDEAEILTRGCCEHGIDLGFCPAGCDEYDDED
ncbi:hypothetical protein [Acetobacter okinawensis]|uniref:hypothetical protein n=1 Tax=Acetobacter okinawensis TaxID=1076594 RepID=UPI0004705AA6|nr:hypothetical protein [Acetobacter okinawensis]